jgi:hypothetical protein
MACNCNKKKVAAATHVVRFPDGTSKTYRSATEAKVAVARKGGTYTVTDG